MSDDDWDVSDSEAAAAPPQKIVSKWDDEDADENDVKDSWDAESEDESLSSKTKPEPIKKASLPLKKKTALQQKLAIRKEQEEAEKARRLAQREETETERKIRLRNEVMESDLENIRTLVGDLGVDVPPSLITGTNLSNMQPSNRAELLEYAEMLKKKTAEFENQASYAIFAEEVIRNLVSSLNVDDTRKISSCLTAIINDKQKQLKELQGKGKKKASTKKGINVQRGGEFENYADDTYNEYDDFM